jgi:hypothetical protein
MYFFKITKRFLEIMDDDNKKWKGNNEILRNISEVLKSHTERITHLERMIGIRK